MVSLKLFLMTKNEFELLEDWLKYHGYLFGLNNIHVLDGSDDERIFEIYDKYRPLGLNVHFSFVGLNCLAEELTKLMHANKSPDSFLMKLDTDEFLAHPFPVTTDPVAAASESEAGNSAQNLSNSSFAEILGGLPVTGQRYKASLVAWSLPGHEYLFHPARDLVSFTPIQSTTLKSYFHSDSFVAVDIGSHNGVSTNNEGFIDTSLTLIHYHSTSVEDTMRRAKQVLISHEYIRPTDSVEAQFQKLSDLRAQGVKKSSHKMDLYLKHLASLQGGDPVHPSELNAQHPYFRSSDQSIEVNLVRDTLSQIDRHQHFGE